eukprot:504310-Rhodomonas_salina.1
MEWGSQGLQWQAFLLSLYRGDINSYVPEADHTEQPSVNTSGFPGAFNFTETWSPTDDVRLYQALFATSPLRPPVKLLKPEVLAATGRRLLDWRETWAAVTCLLYTSDAADDM